MQVNPGRIKKTANNVPGQSLTLNILIYGLDQTVLRFFKMLVAGCEQWYTPISVQVFGADADIPQRTCSGYCSGMLFYKY